MLNAPYFISTQSRTYIKAEGELKLWKKKHEKIIIVTKTFLDEKCAKYTTEFGSRDKKSSVGINFMLKDQRLITSTNTTYVNQYYLRSKHPFWGGYYCHITVSIVFLFFFRVNAYSRNWKHMGADQASYKQSGAYFYLFLTGRNICWPNLSAADTKGILNKVSSERFRLQCLSRFIDLRHCQSILTWANILNGVLLVVLLSSVHKWLKGKLGNCLKNTNIF